MAAIFHIGGESNDLSSLMRKNPEKGIRLIMDRYKEAIYWHIRRLVVSHADAQDATQETFIRVYRSFSKLKDTASLKPWIYKIATNEAMRLIQRRKGGTELSLDDTLMSPDVIETQEYIDLSDSAAVKIQKAILSLPAKQQLAFSLRYYDELSYEEIAEITSSAPANVKANYHFAKNNVIKYLKEHD